MRIRGLKTARDLLRGRCTPAQVLYQIQMRLFSRQPNLGDDFDWTKYHKHYLEELRYTERVHTLLLAPGNFMLHESRIRLAAGLKPLHPNHQVLYETVLRLQPHSALEFGCGGGDHLHNLAQLCPQMHLRGLDRSEFQLRTLRTRHPALQSSVTVQDVTQPQLGLSPADVVYSQAVLMHISESGGRYLNALANMIRTAKRQVVLVENWSRHNFLRDAQSILGDRENGWDGGFFYINLAKSQPGSYALIISKNQLDLEPITSYELLERSARG